MIYRSHLPTAAPCEYVILCLTLTPATAYTLFALRPSHYPPRYTPLFNAMIAYTFFGLDELARQLETPFGLEPQCLPLDDMCRVIEAAAAQALGDTIDERERKPKLRRSFNLL